MKRLVPILALATGMLWILTPREALSHGPVTTTVLFDREIVRVLNNHCVMCHTDGGPSFPISTYEQTWLQRLPMRTAVLRRHMPPWSAVAGYGQFANANGLTLRELQFMVSWAEGLGPRNAGAVFLNVSDPRASPRQEVSAVAHVGRWMAGQPDLTRTLPPMRIEAGEGDVTKRAVVDLGLTASRDVIGIEYMPDNRRAVRAAVFTVEATGQWLGSWTPWYGFVTLPAGVAYRLAPGTKIVAELLYRKQGAAATDAGTLGLVFAKARARTSPRDLVLDAQAVGASTMSRRRLKAVARLAADTSLLALRPNVVPGLASLELAARKPDGGTEVLLFLKDPSPEWPTPYILKTPVKLPRGTELSLVAQVDASAGSTSSVRLIISRY